MSPTKHYLQNLQNCPAAPAGQSTTFITGDSIWQAEMRLADVISVPHSHALSAVCHLLLAACSLLQLECLAHQLNAVASVRIGLSYRSDGCCCVRDERLVNAIKIHQCWLHKEAQHAVWQLEDACPGEANLGKGSGNISVPRA